MGLSNLDAPPYRMILTVVSVVVSLHILTAVAIVMVQPPLAVIEKEQPVEPIEIQLLSVPVESPKPVVEKTITEPVVVPQKTVPQSKPKLAETIKPRPVTPTKPIVKPQVNKPVEVKQKIEPAKQAPKKPPVLVESKANPITSTQVAEQQAYEQRQQETAAQAHAEAVRQQQAQDQKRATELAAAEAQRQAQEAQNAKAAKEAEQRDAEAQAANNNPVSFTANSASWASLPNFSFPSRAERGARSGDTFTVVLVLRVNKQGSIESVSVSKSSGNREIDRAAQQQVRQGRFKPFTKEGIARVGNVTLPIRYQMP